MPLLRKIVSIGDSKAVIIPHDYIEFFKKQGKEFQEVGLEFKGDDIIIIPLLKDTVEKKIMPTESVATE